MYGDVILIHRPGGQGRSTLSDDLQQVVREEGLAEGLFSWQTCLRQIALLDESRLESVRPFLLRGDEIYHGDVAYRFLLEVICGLHSPLIGETEVYGQFKNAVASHEVPLSPWGSCLKRLFRSLFEDAKQIRQEYLEDLGSQSYGSILRRDLKDFHRLHIVGAGQLVQEILPWLASAENDVHIHARNLEKARSMVASATVQKPLQKLVQLHGLEERGPVAQAEVVIVAAPVSAEFMHRWLSECRDVRLIVDLRADSATDPISVPMRPDSLKPMIPTIDLNEVFRRLAANQALLEARKAAALRAISEAAMARGGFVENRPFGWEDVCA